MMPYLNNTIVCINNDAKTKTGNCFVHVIDNTPIMQSKRPDMRAEFIRGFLNHSMYKIHNTHIHSRGYTLDTFTETLQEKHNTHR